MADSPNRIPRFKGEVLLCEDSETGRHLIKSHLSRLGLEVSVACNGKEGIELVWSRKQSGRRPFDLIFMDIYMPVMGGLEAADMLEKMGVQTHVVALTAGSGPDGAENRKAGGISEWLGKPFTERELWDCLGRYLTPLEPEEADEAQIAAEREKQRRRLFSGFVRKNRTTFDEISAAIEKGDLKLAHRLAHTLRGLAGMMEKAALREAARAVEQSLAEEKTRDIWEQMELLGREMAATLEELAPFAKEPESVSQDIPLDREKARELFDRLQPVLESDSARCREMVEELREVPGTGPLIAQIEEYEFEAALEVLSGLRQTLGV